MEKIKTALLGLKRWAGKKLVIALAGYLLTAVKSSHPDWPIPSEEFTLDVILALLTAHTLTDITAILKAAGKEVWSGKAG